MSLNRIFKKVKLRRIREDLGLGLPPGDAHYRAYVGPPEDYDLIAAMSFNLLTSLGLRQNHTVLDIGCGSLRIGRLLIPYLNSGSYVGIEPNRWLVHEGIKRETGRDQIRIKKPRFYFVDSASELSTNEVFDFAIAHSIFSHCGLDLFENWLSDISIHLNSTGALVATFLVGEQDHQGHGWSYPETVKYSVDTIQTLSSNALLGFIQLDWKHPRQQWALFTKPDFDSTWLENGVVSWNRFLEF